MFIGHDTFTCYISLITRENRKYRYIPAVSFLEIEVTRIVPIRSQEMTNQHLSGILTFTDTFDFCVSED